MPMTVDAICAEASALPSEAKADLLDRLLVDAVDNMDSEIERAHLAVIRRRLDEIENGTARLIPGDEALAYVRRIVER